MVGINSKVQAASKELSRIISKVLDASSAGDYTGRLESDLQKIQFEQYPIDALILGHGGPDLDKISIWNTEVQVNGKATQEISDFKIHWHDLDHFPRKKVGDWQANVRLMFLLEGYDSLDEDDREYAIEKLLKGASLVYVFSNVSEKAPIAKLMSSIKMRLWDASIAPLNEYNPENPLHFVDPNALQLAKVQAAFNMIIKHSQALDIILEGERKDFDAKKMVLQREVDELKKKGNSRSGQEQFMQIKTSFARSINEFEKGISERMASLVKSQSGSLYSHLESNIDEMNELVEVKEHGQDKFQLPTLQDELIEQIQINVAEHLSNDVKSLNDFFDMMLDDVKKQSEEIGLNNMRIHCNSFDANRIDYLIADMVQYDKEFEAKGANKGFMSMVSAARQPLMILMISGSALSPILALFSGEERTVGLKENKTVYGSMVVVLLLAGIYLARKKSKDEQRMKKDEALKKGKQYLKTEVKRMLASIEREWKPQYLGFLKDEANRLISEIEYFYKSFQESSSQKVSEEMAFAQRKVQKLTNQEKQLDMGGREKQNFDGKLNQLNSEFRSEYIKLNRRTV